MNDIHPLHSNRQVATLSALGQASPDLLRFGVDSTFRVSLRPITEQSIGDRRPLESSQEAQHHFPVSSIHHLIVIHIEIQGTDEEDLAVESLQLIRRGCWIVHEERPLALVPGFRFLVNGRPFDGTHGVNIGAVPRFQ